MGLYHKIYSIPYVPTKKVFSAEKELSAGPLCRCEGLRISFEWLPLGARLWPNYLSLRAAPTCDNGFIALSKQVNVCVEVNYMYLPIGRDLINTYSS
jgi:hypothetical protein